MNRNPARRIAGLAGLLGLLCLTACGPGMGTVLEVSLADEDLPAATARMEASLRVDGRSAKGPGGAEGRPAVEIAARVDHFSVTLPVGVRGPLELRVRAFGAGNEDVPEGCLLAEGQAMETLSGQPVLELAVPLMPAASCSVPEEMMPPTSPWELKPGPSAADLLSLYVSAPGEVWVGTSDDKVWHRSGGAWGLELGGTKPDSILSALAVRNKAVVAVETTRGPSDAMDATIVHYRPAGGGSFQKQQFKGRINGVSLAPPALQGTNTRVLFAGDIGVLPWEAGGPMMVGAPLVDTGAKQLPLFAVHYFGETGPRRAVAVGRSGSIYGGGSETLAFVPTPEPSTTLQDLRAVWALGPTDIWAVGDAGTILHFEGGGWRALLAPFGNGASLRGVWGASSTAVWFVGTGGVILRWDGTSFQQQVSPTKQDLNAIAGLPAAAGGREEVWAVGAKGTVLHLAR